MTNDGDLALAPLGAGDLIDRAVRLYRHHFVTLIGIASPPVLVSALGWTIAIIGWRAAGNASETVDSLLYALVVITGATIIIAGYLFSLIVMGGATRNFVSHLIWNEPVSARITYRAVKSRFWSLFGASLLIGFWLVFSAMIASMAYGTFSFIMFAAIGLSSYLSPWISGIVGAILLFTGVTLGMVLFFLLAGRMAYVPQAILVEGRGIFSAVGRSFSLASGNVRRLMAMTLFSSFATYSALLLLFIPLSWYAYLNGVDLSPFGGNQPTWYAIAYEVILQCSHILLAPIWMLGLSLLYVDERVRHEGYDIELMAARRLPPMPELPGVVSPFAPALVTGRAPRFVPPPPGPMSPGSVLGLH